MAAQEFDCFCGENVGDAVLSVPPALSF